MQGLHDLAEIIARAAYLLALAVAPPLFSPEPAPAARPILASLLALAVIAALLFAAARLRARAGGVEGRAAAALIWISVAAALGAAAYFRADRAPLGRGLLAVAIPIWGALAAVAAIVGERRFAANFRHKRAVAAILTITLGGALVASASSWIGSPPRMWAEALARDGENARALDELTRAPMRAKRWAAARAIVGECLALHPESCACQARRADLAIRARAFGEALEQARAVSERCPADPAAQAILAEALALQGDASEAEGEARRGLELGGPEARLRYALAVALNRLGKRADALAEARLALERGGGRDAALLVGALAIDAGELDVAARALEPIAAADPSDGDAQYDLALVADKRGDYNRARTGYLAALRADPKLASARYNLVVLTQRRGVGEEAKHHAKKFQEAFPDDPRGAEIARIVSPPPEPPR